ncbi:hypothetical protein FBUS_07761 [Fasciolopsis buskii]|uniref:Uncharacterized protein n=1 Tax=Fasciolopsis buskii TaxID=27845 RepID=A0A8E0VHK7_9TREM|nr:hypothetical protein FBUS_07761 [Fasciolopsis buski]
MYHSSSCTSSDFDSLLQQYATDLMNYRSPLRTDNGDNDAESPYNYPGRSALPRQTVINEDPDYRWSETIQTQFTCSSKFSSQTNLVWNRANEAPNQTNGIAVMEPIEGLITCHPKISLQYSVMYFLSSNPAILESPEILAQCALDAAGSSIIRLPADSTHSNRLGLETLNVNQKLLRLLLDHVREVAQPKHVQQILNFRHPMENPDSPTILHRVITAHSAENDLTWSIDQLVKAGADQLLKAIVKIPHIRPERLQKLSSIQLAASTVYYGQLLPILVQNLNMIQQNVISGLNERFYCGERTISVGEQLSSKLD